MLFKIFALNKLCQLLKLNSKHSFTKVYLYKNHKINWLVMNYIKIGQSFVFNKMWVTISSLILPSQSSIDVCG